MVSDIRMLASREATVPDILIRNVNAAVIEILKTRAKRSGTSLQYEAKQVLESSVKYSWPEFALVARELRAETAHTPQTDSTLLIREDRDSR
jgi:plasmid stability protein